MIRGIIGTSLNFRFLVIVAAVIVMVAGIGQVQQMPVDFLPEFSAPFVEIQTEALGLSAKEVEQMITVPMEQDLLAGVAWLDVIRSESVPGLSSVLIYFEPGTNIYKARQMVAERIAQSAVGLPHVSSPPTMIQPLSSTSRFMIVGLSSKQLSLIQMSVLARWVIGPRLMGVPGVAHVAIWGNRDRQLQVQVNPERLQAQGVSLQQVIQTTGNALWVSPLSYLEASSPGTGGFIDTPNQRLGIWHVLPIASAEDLSRVPVEETEGLRLGDVATVVEDHQPLIGDAIVNGTPNLLLVIEKLPGMNTVEVTQGVETALDALRPGFTGIDFDATLFRPASYLETAIQNLSLSLIIGAALVVLLLFAFLYNWRVALISIIAIPVSLTAALFVLASRGVTMNALVFAGLVVALGVIFDDAISDVETMARRLRHKEEGSQPAKIILEASLEMRGSVFIATLIVALVTLPVFFLDGITAAMFRPMAVSYLLALLASMVVALTLTPALGMIILGGAPLSRRESPVVAWLRRGYGRALAWVLRRPRMAYLAIAVILIAGLAVVPFIQQSQVLPSFKEPYLMIQIEGAPATSHPEMNRIVTRISDEVRAIPGVKNVGAHVGRAIFGDQTVGINSAQLMVSIDPRAEYNTTVAAVQEAIDGYSGLVRQVHTYMQQVLSQPMEKTAANNLTVRLFGEDYNVLTTEAEKLRQTLAHVNGVADSKVLFATEEPTLEIEVNLDAAEHYGIKPGDVRRTAATLLSGILVGNLFEEQKVFDVVVWATPEYRNNLSDVKNLLIETPGGGHVRLSDVASVRMVSMPTVIRREAVSPYLDISLTMQGRDARAIVRDVWATIGNYSFPLEYHAEVQDSYAAQQTVLQGLLIAAIIALVGIFLLLQAASANWEFATLAFITLPAALAGGALAAFFTKGDLFSLSSLAGLVTVLGLVVRSTLLLARRYQYLEQQEGEGFSPGLILQGARERLGPSLLSTLATALALLPFVIFGSIPGQEIVYPMAIVILGGLVTATLTNLFIVPCLYMLSRPSREPELMLNLEPHAPPAD